MPRQAHGRPLQRAGLARPTKRKPVKFKSLNALEIAERDNPDQIKIARHRLGVVEDDSDDDQGDSNGDERSSKRRKTGEQEENGGSEDSGSDIDGQRWHVGVEEEDEDSDIDSEDAFGESDEDKFTGFTFRGSRQQQNGLRSTKNPPRRLNLDEDSDIDEDEQEDDDDNDSLGEDAVDLATAFDMNEALEREEAETKPKRKRVNSSDFAEDNSSEEQDDSNEEDRDDEDDAESQLSVSDEDEGDHSRLQSFVEGLGTQSQTKTSEAKNKKFTSLSGKPRQFGLSSSKISAADLLQYVKDPQQRQALKILQDNERKGAENYKGGIPGKLAPPLAKRQQDRLDRVAAYDQSKKELSKWTETVKRNRRAEHLTFPLPDPNAVSDTIARQLAPISGVQPLTNLESKIQAIMQESGMVDQNGQSAEDQEQAYEELQEKKMSLEEVQVRRAELRKTRDLLFREEIRARRLRKIKSKAYRRIHRKEREKGKLEERALLSAAGLVNSDDEREQNDRQRAEERMGARHRESKWAKSMKATGRGKWDDDARNAISDLARRDEELRRRVEGKFVHESDESGSESSLGSGSEDGFGDIEDKLRSIGPSANEDSVTGLAGMAFMRKAEAARKAANEAEIREIRRGMQDISDNEDEFAASDADEQIGRQKYGPKKEDIVAVKELPLDRSEFEERMSDDDDAPEPTHESGTAVRSSNLPLTPTTKEKVAGQKDLIKEQSNISLKTERSPIRAVQSEKISKFRKNAEATAAQATGRTHEQEIQDNTSSSGSEAEESAIDDAGHEPATLVEAVFFGPDDVVQEFAREKQEIAEAEDDQIIDERLPGWGSWTGDGISKKAQKRAQGRSVTKIPGVAKDKRQDAKLDRVIVNEKRVKKNGKYLATELPHPFESKQQYERSLRLPMGPEWTTKTTFQDATKPRILIKQGIIRPMAKPLA